MNQWRIQNTILLLTITKWNCLCALEVDIPLCCQGFGYYPYVEKLYVYSTHAQLDLGPEILLVIVKFQFPQCPTTWLQYMRYLDKHYNVLWENCSTAYNYKAPYH